MRIVLCLLTVVWLCSCQPKEASPNDVPSVSDVTAKVADSITPTHPSITQETMNMLWEKCTHIDYIFTPCLIPSVRITMLNLGSCLGIFLPMQHRYSLIAKPLPQSCTMAMEKNY
ncbi:MAG: hypothetical protein HC892_14280 [Saprospiraceae bacterium]|nr:hypothetical protein [Saprospiraceae bacterium]